MKAWAPDAATAKTKTLHSSRKTYIDDIFYQQKKENMPAPNSYTLTETEEERKGRLEKLQERKTKRSDRLSFLDTVQLESSKVPGPGEYNPHVQQPLIQEIRPHGSNHTSSFMKQISPSKGDRNPVPGMCKYDPMVMDTFAARSNLEKKYAGKRVYSGDMQTCFGTSARLLIDPRNTKELKASKEKEKEQSKHSPGPGQYKVTSDWPAKNEPARRSIFRAISTGVLHGVYH